MIEDIISGISNALHTEFGDDYAIYTEAMEQGITEPCFFIRGLNIQHMLMFWRRYRRVDPLVIQYLPPSDCTAKESCNTVAEQLFECLELITVDGDLVRGTNMHYEIIDDILSFFVNYDMSLIKQVEETDMEELEHTITEKEG